MPAVPGSATSASLARAQGSQESHIAAAKAKRESQERGTGAQRRSNDEGSMRPADDVIISHLEDEWRTASAVHRLLGERGGVVADIAYALERLARAGKIEAKHVAAMAPRYRHKAGPPVLSRDFYRKLQRRR
jgi:hypothetical protein